MKDEINGKELDAIERLLKHGQTSWKGQLDDIGRLVRALQAARQREVWWEKVVKDMSDDMECLPGCDSYGHEEFCPVTNAAAAWRQLRERAEAAERAVGIMRTELHSMLEMAHEGVVPEWPNIERWIENLLDSTAALAGEKEKP